MSFLQRDEPEQPVDSLFQPETYVNATIEWQRRLPGRLLAAPMVIAFIALLATRGEMVSWAISVPRLVQGHWELIVLHMFAHGGLIHIIFNISALLAFGPPVMERLGPFSQRSFTAFLLLFFGSGLAAMTLWLALNPTSEIPVLGASGAIFGLIGFLLRLPDPHGDPVPLRGRQMGRAITEWAKMHLPLIAFFLIPVILGGQHFGLAWEAHLGGFLAGMLLCKPLWKWCGGQPDWVPDEEGKAAA
jgi:membrane associated rhomboid family serine protease